MRNHKKIVRQVKQSLAKTQYLQEFPLSLEMNPKASYVQWFLQVSALLTRKMLLFAYSLRKTSNQELSPVKYQRINEIRTIKTQKEIEMKTGENNLTNYCISSQRLVAANTADNRIQGMYSIKICTPNQSWTCLIVFSLLCANTIQSSLPNFLHCTEICSVTSPCSYQGHRKHISDKSKSRLQLQFLKYFAVAKIMPSPFGLIA